MKINGQLTRALLFILMTIPQLSYGWGQDGHKIVALVGSQNTGAGALFWKANSANIVNLTTVPDFFWKQGPLSRPETVTHFFQPDSYFKNPADFGKIPKDFKLVSKMVGQQKAIEFGTAGWRVEQFYNLALAALKKQDFKTAVEMVGVMSHYIGDLSQPLHVTDNYDGQKTNNEGIHKFFETTNVKPHALALVKPVTLTARKLMRDPEFLKHFKGTITDVMFNETFRTYTFKNLLIETDLKLGRKTEGAKAQLGLAQQRLSDGAATFALVLSHLWAESGLKDAGVSVQVTVPPWIKPNYYDVRAQLADQIEFKTRQLLLGDDCGE